MRAADFDVDKNNSHGEHLKKSRAVHAYYSRTQPIFTRTRFSHDGQNFIVNYLNLNLRFVFFDLCGKFFHTGRITKYY